MMKKNGFRLCSLRLRSRTRLLPFSMLAYFAEVTYQRFAPAFLRSAIIAFGRIVKNPEWYATAPEPENRADDEDPNVGCGTTLMKPVNTTTVSPQ